MYTAVAMPHQIRRVNIRYDLLPVADLIELCFASTLDEDGRDYLRHLRMAARDLNYLSWMQGAAERIASPLYGFVWEEGDQIIGNLSLIPLYRRGRLYYLIANVAVHPRARGRGIGRALTGAALEYLRNRGVNTAWLQVRADNDIAFHLYKSFGFVERARRTTWVSSPPFMPEYQRAYPDISIHYRRRRDWSRQLYWLQQNYPPVVSWNLPIYFARLSSSPWQRLVRFLRGEALEHWTARRGDELLGVLTWEPMRGSSDTLWLAAPAALEAPVLETLLPYARQALSRRRRALSLNYPAGRGEDSFLHSGFTNHQTLIWMSIDLSKDSTRSGGEI